MATPDRQKSNSSTVHSVVVTVKLLEFLATSGRPQRVTDIATGLDMTKARVSRHLSTLADLGLVARMPDNSGYRLGPTLLRLSKAALDQQQQNAGSQGRSWYAMDDSNVAHRAPDSSLFIRPHTRAYPRKAQRPQHRRGTCVRRQRHAQHDGNHSKSVLRI